jgi:uncharacterized protein (TIGR00730 family)
MVDALSSGFIALPGGLGTLEELFEALTWTQLGLHGKPVVLLDVDGYYGPLAKLLDHALVVVRSVPASSDVRSGTQLLIQRVGPWCQGRSSVCLR